MKTLILPVGRGEGGMNNPNCPKHLEPFLKLEKAKSAAKSVSSISA